MRAGGAAELELRATDHAPEAAVAEEPSLRLVNDTDREQLFILERTALERSGPARSRGDALQVFRHLFANEALRPGEPISVGKRRASIPGRASQSPRTSGSARPSPRRATRRSLVRDGRRRVQAVLADPEVSDLLAGELRAEPIERTLKGFEDESFELWSVAS